MNKYKDESPFILKKVRKEFKLTQKEIAETLGISQGTYSKIESGYLELSAMQWMIFCEEYDVRPNAIIDRTLKERIFKRWIWI